MESTDGNKMVGRRGAAVGGRKKRGLRKTAKGDSDMNWPCGQVKKKWPMLQGGIRRKWSVFHWTD